MMVVQPRFIISHEEAMPLSDTTTESSLPCVPAGMPPGPVRTELKRYALLSLTSTLTSTSGSSRDTRMPLSRNLPRISFPRCSASVRLVYGCVPVLLVRTAKVAPGKSSGSENSRTALVSESISLSASETALKETTPKVLESISQDFLQSSESTNNLPRVEDITQGTRARRCFRLMSSVRAFSNLLRTGGLFSPSSPYRTMSLGIRPAIPLASNKTFHRIAAIDGKPKIGGQHSLNRTAQEG